MVVSELRQRMSGAHAGSLRGDVFGGLTAGIVALPLALAFGEASGAGPIAGLYGAVFVGFFASVFGGTRTQVSGPTGPMVVVFAGLFSTLSGDVRLIFTAVLLAGVFQILFGVLKLGGYIKLVPYPVISGFMSGIGVIIIVLQLPNLLGVEVQESGTFGALRAFGSGVSDPGLQALGIGLLALVIVFAWPSRLSRLVPGSLVALVVGTVVALALPEIPKLGDIPSGLPSVVLPMVTPDSARLVVEAALILALLGSIDSLLTSLVADNMTRTRHESNRELIGQGLGNSVAGLFGAIPGAGATMRTAVNIRSGGRTRLSGIIHALVLLAIVLALGPLAAHIPQAVLAGILVKVGYDILDMQYLRRAHKGPPWDLVLMLVVLALTVLVDLITAVSVGVVLASLAYVHRVAKDQVEAFRDGKRDELTADERGLIERTGGRIEVFSFSGPLSFGAAAELSHLARHRAQPHTNAMVLDFVRIPYVDLSAAIAIETVINDAGHSGTDVYVSGMNEPVRAALSRFGVLERFPGENIHDSRQEALTAAERNLSHDESDSGVARTTPESL